MPRPPRCLCGDCQVCHKRAYDKGYRKTRKDTPRDHGADERRRRARGRAFIDSLKAAGCAVCGFDVPIALDFHHCDPTAKTADVTRLVLCSKERILEEVGKCVLLCSNHHRMLHAGLIGGGFLGARANG